MKVGGSNIDTNETKLQGSAAGTLPLITNGHTTIDTTYLGRKLLRFKL